MSVKQIHAGSADSIVPETALICGTVRTFDPEVRARDKRRPMTERAQPTQR